MCDLITIGVRRAHAEEVRSPRLPRVDRQSNPSIQKLFGADFILFSITDGGCSCRMFSSSSAVDETRASEERSKRRKYRQRGWSEEKIEALSRSRLHGRGMQDYATTLPLSSPMLPELRAKFG